MGTTLLTSKGFAVLLDLVRQLRRFDQKRPAVPGEHLFAALSGISLLRSGIRSRSTIVRAVTIGAGLAMLYRAASGRDGLAKLVGRSDTERPGRWLD